MTINLRFTDRDASGYKSSSQKIRILTESWVDAQAYCPSCGFNLQKYENNRPVADFFCKNCTEDFELKSKKDKLSGKILDGAYQAALKRLRSNDNPNFFLLNYNPHKLNVVNFFVVPKYFFTPDMLEPRKPLSQTARRAGWIGCNIMFQKVPEAGKIFYIRNGSIKNKRSVLENWKKTLFLKNEKEFSIKGWLLDLMNCIDRLGKKEFFLDDMYKFETQLQQKHPANKHIKDKIRQQLQFLRDKGYLRFIGRGRYRIV